MKNKNGFTLIEVLSVIIIMGVIMIIAVPAVTKYIFKSDKSVYASNVSAFVESVRAKYEMKEYGAVLKDDEIMVVPIGHIILEKGDAKNSPYGEYDFTRSYVLIVPEKSAYNFYATVVDKKNVGIINTPPNKLDEYAVKLEINVNEIPILTSYNNPLSTYIYEESYKLPDGTDAVKKKVYKRSDVRAIEGEGINQGEYAYIFKDTGTLLD